MKTKGLFTECTLTSKKPVISGKTSNGIAIYADSEDVKKGFQMFRNYKIMVFDDGEEVPNHGFCHRSRIIRLPLFDFWQIPEWLRIEKLKTLLVGDPEVAGAVARVEGVIPERLLASNSTNISTLQP